MAGTRIFKETDSDGRWWEFDEQQKDNSCGPTSVKIVKEYVHTTKIGEEAIRGLLGLIINGELHSGKKLLVADVETADVWDKQGTLEAYVLKALHSEPCRIPKARLVQDIAELRKSSRNHPAILGFNWPVSGGHFVVCVGPTRTDPDRFVILDPWHGLQYLSVAGAIGNTFYYTTPDGITGQIDAGGYIVTNS